MKNLFRRMLSLFLAVIMTVGMFPVSVFAAMPQPEWAVFDETPAESVNVTFTLSYDGAIVIGNDTDETRLNRVEITVPYFDLSVYGLQDFTRMGADGNVVQRPTVLHAYIYMLEHYFYGNPEKEFWKNPTNLSTGMDAKNEKDVYFGSTDGSGLSVAGMSGGMYATSFWGYSGDCVLYYVNHHEALGYYDINDAEGPAWGWYNSFATTADYVPLVDGDCIDVGMFTTTPWVAETAGNAYMNDFKNSENIELSAGDSYTWNSAYFDLNWVNETMNPELSWKVIDDSDNVVATSDGASSEFTYKFETAGKYIVIGYGKDEYTLPAVATVTVKGEESDDETEEDNVYISVSYDDKYIQDINGDYIAYVEIPLSEIAKVDLTSYGLDEYRYDKDGDGVFETTALQLVIYAHENLYGGKWEDVTFTGAPGSSYFAGGIFGFTENLNYFLNGIYPMDEELSEAWGYGVGATSDRIILEAGDVIEIGSFTSWDFYSDSAYGFHEFADSEGNFTHKYETEPGKELSVKLTRSYSGMGSGQIIYDEAYYDIHYGKEYNKATGTATTDENGNANITFAESGTYYVWCDGGYGYEFSESIVNTPAFAVVKVGGTEEPEANPGSITLDQAEISLKTGKTATLVASVEPGDETAETIDWTSSDEEVATVDEKGVVTAKGIGEAVITATCGNLSANCKVTVSEPDAYLESLIFASGTKKDTAYELTPVFDGKTKEYNILVQDTNSMLRVWATLSANAPEGSAITAKWTKYNGEESSKVIVSGKSSAEIIASIIQKSTVGNDSLVIEVGVEGDLQVYKFSVKRTPSLAGITLADKFGANLPLDAKFSEKVYEYAASTTSETVTIEAIPYDESYSITFNGSESNVVALQNGENKIEIKAKNPEGFETVYTVNITKLEPTKVKFDVSPKEAVVFVSDKNSTTAWPNENGEYELAPGEEYSYNVTATGYKGVSGTLVADAGKTIEVSLEKAVKTVFEELESIWPNFGFNKENNIVIDRPTPIKAEETSLYWAKLVGEGYDTGAVGVPIIVDDYLYTYTGKTIMKLDKVTGDVLETGNMTGGSSAYAICSLTYAEGMVFVGLNNGTVQAFNAETLESLWIYRDPLKGQPNAQITYSEGYVYTGFWASETGNANFVCLSVSDEDPEKTDEEKIATWRHSQKGGFYWAGAYIEGDYLYIGTDDGESGYQKGYAQLLSIDKHSGKVVSSVTMPNVGDIRSSITCAEGKLYFTSKGGYFYEAEYNGKTGEITALRSLALENGGNGVPMSTSTPTVYKGRAYIGVSGQGQFVPYSGHNITVIDIEKWEIAYSVPTKGYPQTTGTLSTHYEEAEGYVYVYFFDNFTPGTLRVLKDKAGVTEPLLTTEETTNGVTYTLAEKIYEPAGELAQYCICTPIIDTDGTLYFKNDSANLFAVGSAVKEIKVTTNPDKMKYKPGESFDPTGMVVTGYYYNGTERDITKYVSYSTEPFTDKQGKVNFRIVFEFSGGEEKPYDILEITVDDGFVKLEPVEVEKKKTLTALNDTVKFYEVEGYPDVRFVEDPKGGVFYLAIMGDKEYENVKFNVDGYLSATEIDFDPEKYRSIGETYSVYNTLEGKVVENGAGLKYEDAKELAKELNDENKVTFYKVKCDQFIYVAKITVPKHYGVSYDMGEYWVTAELDGVKYSSKAIKVITDVSIFEYENLKWSAKEDAVSVLDEGTRGYSGYFSYLLGYGKGEYGLMLEAPLAKELPTVISTTGFRAIAGKELDIRCGERVKINIPEVSRLQRGVNFIYKNTVGEIDEETKATSYVLEFFGKQPVASDFTIEWNLGINAFQLRESFKIKVEENDIITYYITKDGKYFDEFTIDYMTADMKEDIVLTFENEGGSTLGRYQITTQRPADADSALAGGEEINPNTGAPIF